MSSDPFHTGHQGPRVMVADDSAIVRKRVHALLAEDGHVGQIIEAESAAEAWLLFKFYHPDIVVLDLQFRDFSGLEVLRRIKQSAPKCVVFVLTNYREMEAEDECRKHGADCFLHKSTEFEKVCEKIRKLPRR